MRTKNSKLSHLARLHGINPVYIDELGHRRITPDHSVRRLLALIGVPAENDRRIRQAVRDARLRPWRKIVEDTLVVRRHAYPQTWMVHLPLGPSPLTSLTLTWTITGESGSAYRQRVSGDGLRVTATKRVDGLRHIRVALPFPKHLVDGYYRIHVYAEALSQRWEGTMVLIVTPERCYLPSDGKPVWGLTVQLYGLRSPRNWGIGDFRDLRDVITWAGRELGAAMVGVNPLHALPPGEISPYSPSSRLFHNPIYLDIESIPEFRVRPEFTRILRRPAFRTTLIHLRQSETVQYDAVRTLKWSMLEKLYRIFRADHLRQETDRGKAFRRFIRERGESLERFALFQAIQESMTRNGRDKNRTGWRSWPRPLRRPDSAAVKKFCGAHVDRVTFFQYLEWQCDLQMKAAQSAAHRAGMAIGLYKDLAVGLDPNGADAWAFQDQLGQGASVGSPPDMFSPRGQNWGLAPLHPATAKTYGYHVFVECFRQNMRHSGLLRIDHAMGLFRLFWVPEGSDPAAGGYVYYPAKDFLGILALESHRQKVIIVGEDLGTVTPEIRQELMQAGVLSYRLLLFEKTKAGRFIPPRNYPSQAMASVTTHDLPTLRGFWIERDIDLKEQLKLYPARSLRERDRNTRRQDRQALLSALRHEDLLPAADTDTHRMPEMDDALSRSVYAYLARTPCRLVVVPLEDLLGDIDSPNLPGAPAQAYPLWRIKVGPPGSTLRDWRKDARVRAMVEGLRGERPQGS